MRSGFDRAGRSVTGAVGVRTLWALAVLVASCGGKPGSSDILDDSTYVQVMSELASLRWRFQTRDSLAADSARFATLQNRGVTMQDLERFAEHRGGDPDAMIALWELIAARADELAGTAGREDDDQLRPNDSMSVRRR